MDYLDYCEKLRKAMDILAKASEQADDFDRPNAIYHCLEAMDTLQEAPDGFLSDKHVKKDFDEMKKGLKTSLESLTEHLDTARRMWKDRQDLDNRLLEAVKECESE